MPLLRLEALIKDYKETKEMNYFNLQDFNNQSLQKGLPQQESALSRILIWNSSVPVVKSHLLFGVGTGDVISSMISYDKSLGLDTINDLSDKQHLFLTVVYHHGNYNIHNQFIQTQMGLGLPGLFILLILTFGVLTYSIVKKDLLLGIFSILIIINFCVESMFQWDYFSLFFSLFLWMFIQKNTLNKKSDTSLSY